MAKENKSDASAIMELQAESLERHRVSGGQLGITNAAIRKTVNVILSSENRVLVSAVVQYYLTKVPEEAHKDKNIYRKVRMRVMTATSVKDSHMQFDKDSENRVWITRQ